MAGEGKNVVWVLKGFEKGRSHSEEAWMGP